MIKYALVCDEAHAFESWFQNAESFETQAKRGFVECPTCGSKRVSKALMAPSVSTSRRKRAIGAEAMRAMAAMASIAKAQAGGAPAASPPAPAAGPVAILDDKHREMREAIRDLHRKLTENSADVGENFPAEARAMHEGDAPHRSIHGKATFEEAKALAEDGVPILPLPALPDERN